MANKLYNEESILEIASAIRSVNGSSNTYTVNEMAGAIGEFRAPVRGVDYWTEEDKRAVIAEVVDSIKVEYPEAHVIYGDVDANNNITIYGELAKGTYTLKYENEDGSVTHIGSLEIGNSDDVVTYTNQIPISTDTDGSVFNSVGYKTASRLASSGDVSTLSNPNASNPAFVTGFIPYKSGQIIRLKNCFIDTDGTSNDTNYYGQDIGGLRVFTYNASKAKCGGFAWNEYASSGMVTDYTIDENGYITQFALRDSNAAFIRLCLGGDPETAILTINEEITD